MESLSKRRKEECDNVVKDNDNFQIKINNLYKEGFKSQYIEYDKEKKSYYFLFEDNKGYSRYIKIWRTFITNDSRTRFDMYEDLVIHVTNKILDEEFLSYFTLGKNIDFIKDEMYDKGKFHTYSFHKGYKRASSSLTYYFFTYKKEIVFPLSNIKSNFMKYLNSDLFDSILNQPSFFLEKELRSYLNNENFIDDIINYYKKNGIYDEICKEESKKVRFEILTEILLDLFSRKNKVNVYKLRSMDEVKIFDLYDIYILNKMPKSVIQKLELSELCNIKNIISQVCIKIFS